MKHEFNELWEAQENSKKVWKLQTTRGIITFQTKGKAIAFQKAIEKGLNNDR